MCVLCMYVLLHTNLLFFLKYIIEIDYTLWLNTKAGLTSNRMCEKLKFRQVKPRITVSSLVHIIMHVANIVIRYQWRVVCYPIATAHCGLFVHVFMTCVWKSLLTLADEFTEAGWGVADLRLFNFIPLKRLPPW